MVILKESLVVVVAIMANSVLLKFGQEDQISKAIFSPQPNFARKI